MLLGYARVSKGDDQSSALQRRAFAEAGVERVFDEAASGGRWDRPALHRLLDQLRPGDVVVVWKLDRLSRSLKDLLAILERVDAAGAGFRSLTEAVDTTAPAGRMLMQMLGVFAEFERAMVRERTSAGLAAGLPALEPLLPLAPKAEVERVTAALKKVADAAKAVAAGEYPEAEVKARLRAGQRRVFRPWVTEPGLWLQWDWGEGPRVGGRGTNLWCAWLAWSRFRVVIAVWDRTLPTIVGCLDTTLRRLGGVPTYALTDNERTVSVDHVAGVAVRHPEIVAVGRHYGMTIRTCVPADPQSKGGSEATVRIAKADLVPTSVNLAEEFRVFGQLEGACRDWCDEVNARPHRETRRPPVEMLAEEQARLHPLPTTPFTVAFGTTRRVNWDSTVSVEGVRYSVPHPLVDTRVWVRFHGDDLVITAVAPGTGRPRARQPRTRDQLH